MKKKKKGSSYIMVIIIMAVIFTVGTSILSVTASDYKMRINESNRIKSLYSADSGLNVVENIIIATSERAIDYADNSVKSIERELLSATPAVTLTDADKKEQFKINYMRYMTANIDGEELINYLIRNAKTLQGDSIKIPEVVQTLNSTDKIIIDLVGSSNNISCNDVITNNSDSSITINTNYISSTDYERTIKVQTTFKTTQGTDTVKKTVETNYKITAPDYKKTIAKNIVPVNIYPVFDGKIITADGNLSISGTSTVLGDIWVKGNSFSSNPIDTFNKYNGGISIENGSLGLNGNIYSNESLSLNNKSTANVTNNIYSLNAYVGKKTSGVASEDNNLNVKDLVVNNDLALNATKSNIIVKGNFFGINDKTTAATTAEKALQSSSIIVNDISSSNTSTLTVQGKSYIMGVAYLDATDDTDNKYQTGESVAVKGNYLAYTHILPGYEDEVELKYFNPLQLIYKINGNEDIPNKAQYFKDYFATNSELKGGGVDLQGPVYSVGAYLKKDGSNKYTAYTSNTSKDSNNKYISNTVLVQDDIDEQKNLYSLNVYEMGLATGTSQVTLPTRTVLNQINFSTTALTSINSFFGQVIYNTDSNKTIEISNGLIKVGTDVYTDNKAIIITTGNVVVSDGTIFTGNIIAAGNVTINGTVDLKYDSNVTNRIIALNKTKLEPIFTTVDSDIKNSVDVTISSNNSVESTVYSKNDYLETSIWKIVGRP